MPTLSLGMIDTENVTPKDLHKRLDFSYPKQIGLTLRATAVGYLLPLAHITLPGKQHRLPRTHHQPSHLPCPSKLDAPASRLTPSWHHREIQKCLLLKNKPLSHRRSVHSLTRKRKDGEPALYLSLACSKFKVHDICRLGTVRMRDRTFAHVT